MPDDLNAAYPPLDVLKPVAEYIWIVDGPIIRFGMPWPKMEFPTRMTIVRAQDGRLFVHSPTRLSDDLIKAVGKLGPVGWVIGPNRIHYWWLPDWKRQFPQAEIWLAPRIREQAGAHIDFDCRELGAQDLYPWDDDLITLPVHGSFMTEMVFFHKSSRTLILTDLIENFEAGKLGSGLKRWLTRLAGIQHPDGQMPRDMRLTFRKQKTELKAAVETMIGWEPERIIIAHGRWFRQGGAAELGRAFRWLLD